MAFWIGLVIVAQFVMALVSLVDRYIVTSGKIGRPIVLAFYVSLLSALAVLLFLFSWIPLPFAEFQVPSFANVHWPSMAVIAYSVLGGVSFIGALVALFTSFKQAEASDVVPVVSSVAAVATLLLSFYVLDTELPHNFLWGFLFLVIGMALVAHFRFTRRLIASTTIAGVLFGVQAIATKLLFLETYFDNGFFWSRIIIALLALCMLLLPNCCNRTVAGEAKQAGKSGFLLILGNKVLAGLASILMLKAIDLGPVSVVQALVGLQFVFLMLFSVFLGHKAPVCVGEHCNTNDRVQKIISVSIIVTGFSLLFV